MKKGTKRSGSVSQIVRDFAGENPTLGPSDIVRELTAKGHKVYAALVSQALKGTPKKAKARKVTKAKTTAAKRKPGRPKAQGSSQFDLASIRVAAEFVKASGSMEQAIEALDSYKTLVKLMG